MFNELRHGLVIFLHLPFRRESDLLPVVLLLLLMLSYYTIYNLKFYLPLVPERGEKGYIF